MATPYCLDMAADGPTILATSGGFRDHDRLRFQFGDLLHYAVGLSGAPGVVPRVCNVGTASDDDPRFQMDVSEEEHSRPQQDPPVPVGWLVSTSPI